ncbi:Methylamine utilization protein mauG [Minicystis rosea]|nr:Methylamine utilization protein mauG [Minicystis rosea]
MLLSDARASLLVVAGLFALVAGCGGDPTSPSGAGGGGGQGTGGGAATYDWGLPPGVPLPSVPADNPMSTVKVELGRRLFYDKRLSANQTQSCASCHKQDLAFTDGAPVALGSTGEHTPRGSMSLANVAYLTALTWGNPILDSLEEQALIPMFGETPPELGLAGKEGEMLDRLSAEPVYQDLFPRAFPEAEGPISLDHVLKAIAAFERSILSFRSPYDRYTYLGDPTGMSEAALRGKDLFFSEQLECFHCHGGFNFSDSVAHAGTTIKEVMFHNTGLYDIDGLGGYPAPNTGIHEITGLASDMGRFRAPTLRNVAITGPYTHDGTVATLAEMLDNYAQGGRVIASGPFAGDGTKNPYKSELITGFSLTDAERADVIAFLESLTDHELLTDPRYADPWAP